MFIVEAVMGGCVMKLTKDTTAEMTGFRVVCDNCGSLSIKPTDPAKATSLTVIQCARCGAVRGTLADLQDLARRADDVFEF
jgi:hypothetical protein